MHSWRTLCSYVVKPHTKPADVQLSQTIRIITGTMRPQNTKWLPVLSNIPPLNIRHYIATKNHLDKSRRHLPLFKVIWEVPRHGLISKRPCWTMLPNISMAEAITLWRAEWKWASLAVKNSFLITQPWWQLAWLHTTMPSLVQAHPCQLRGGEVCSKWIHLGT